MKTSKTSLEVHDVSFYSRLFAPFAGPFLVLVKISVDGVRRRTTRNEQSAKTQKETELAERWGQNDGGRTMTKTCAIFPCHRSATIVPPIASIACIIQFS